MGKKHIYVLIMVLLASILLTACGTNKTTENKATGSQASTQLTSASTAAPDSGSSTAKKTVYPVTVKDSYDRTVVIEKEPQRIISVAPNLTEIVYALGKGDKLAGRTDYCDYPEAAKSIPSIGDLMSVNIEKFIELKPDVVLVSNFFDPKNVKKLEEAGIKVLGINAQESFEGVYEILGKIGMVLNTQDKADAIIEGMKNKVRSVTDKVKDKAKPKVYYVVEFGASHMTAGKDTFIGQMIGMAGGKNVADDVEGWSYSLEKIVANNPDLIICSRYFDSKAGITQTVGYKDLKAVKENKLFEIDNNMLDRQGPRLADGLEALARIIQPEAMK